MLINIARSDIAGTTLQNGTEPIEGSDKKNKILKPDTGKPLPVDLAGNSGGLIGAYHIAEIQETHHDAAKAAPALKKVFRGADAPLHPAADPNQNGEVEGDDRPINNVQAEESHAANLRTNCRVGMRNGLVTVTHSR